MSLIPRLSSLVFFLFLALPVFAQQDVEDRYRPWVRWWWNGDKVDTVELKRELVLLHEAGIGGVEINPIEFPAKRCDSLGIASLPWLSDAWLDALECTLREARRLGMGCDLLVGSGWPFGMETLPMEQRAQVMLTLAIPLEKLPGDTILTPQAIFDAVDPKVTVPNPDRQFELVALYLTPDTLSDLSQVTPLPLSALDSGVVVNRICQVTGHRSQVTNSSGYLYALVRCQSFASVINGAPGASGPILDHMNRDAVEHFLNYMSSRLEGRLGPMSKWLRAYFVDSMELEGCNWTTDFADEFLHRRGYDLMPWLPFIMFQVGRLGDVVSYDYGATQTPVFKRQVQQVRHDFELTKAELLDERYTQTFLAWCRRQGVQSRAQAYGRGFFPLESSLGYDIPEGESWTTNYLRHRVGHEMGDEDYRRGRAYTMINKYVASAAHLAGKRIVSAEEMTNTYMLFNTSLELLKLGSDMSAFSGVTHSVWHGFNYNPPAAGFPGWVQYGSYLNEKNTWWPYFHLLNEYRARMSRMLQQAELQADIAILLPIDDLWAEYGVQTEPFPNYPRGSKYHIPQLLWEAIHKCGGNCDLITPRTKGMKSYNACLSITDTAILLEYQGNNHLLALPDSNRYLEWYAAVQERYGLPHAVSIDTPDRFLLQNHYRTDEGRDMYLFVNAHIDTAITATLTFPDTVWHHHCAWLYDCNSGQRRRLSLWQGRGELCLGSAESTLIIFEPERREARDERREFLTRQPSLDSLVSRLTWQVSLHHAREGWTRDTVMEQLRDLRETSFATFAGTAIYRTTLRLDEEMCDTVLILDLGRVAGVCELSVNGQHLGTAWYGQRAFRVGQWLHAGDNTFEIKVTTLLNNYTRTLTDDPVIQHFVIRRSIPSSPAGLIGPVTLLRQEVGDEGK